jgi:hypothetical protein
MADMAKRIADLVSALASFERWRKVPWRWVAGSLLVGYLLGTSLAPSVAPAVVGMLGLIAGLLIAKQTQQSHLVTSTWPARVAAHQEGWTKLWKLFNELSERQMDETLEWFNAKCLYLSDEAIADLQALIRAARPIAFRQHKEKVGLHEWQALFSQREKCEQSLWRGAGGHLTEHVIVRLSKEETEHRMEQLTRASVGTVR